MCDEKKKSAVCQRETRANTPPPLSPRIYWHDSAAATWCGIFHVFSSALLSPAKHLLEKQIGSTLIPPPPKPEGSFTLYLGPDTMSGPTLSPVALLCSTCLPSHKGNVPDFQHLLPPHGNNKSGHQILGELKPVSAGQVQKNEHRDNTAVAKGRRCGSWLSRDLQSSNSGTFVLERISPADPNPDRTNITPPLLGAGSGDRVGGHRLSSPGPVRPRHYQSWRVRVRTSPFSAT